MSSFLFICAAIVSLWWIWKIIRSSDDPYRKNVTPRVKESREIRECKAELSRIDHQLKLVRAAKAAVISGASNSEVYKILGGETRSKAAGNHWIARFNEAEAFGYISKAGTTHYFRRAGRVEFDQIEGRYKISVIRIRTGEEFYMLTTALTPVPLSTAMNDTATDDAR